MLKVYSRLDAKYKWAVEMLRKKKNSEQRDEVKKNMAESFCIFFTKKSEINYIL